MGARGPFQDKPALRVEALSLARGGRVLFEGLSFIAAPGDHIDIRGPNGAGKTSLLRALAGFLRPRAGTIAFDGVEEPSLALHYVGHLNALKGASSVLAHARYWDGLLGGAASAEFAVQCFDLARQCDLPARVLSQGQARRLALARLLNGPRPFWLLDEPAAGLDSDGRRLLAEVIASHRAQGGVVIAAAHEQWGPAPTRTLTLGAA